MKKKIVLQSAFTDRYNNSIRWMLENLNDVVIDMQNTKDNEIVVDVRSELAMTFLDVMSENDCFTMSDF